MLLTVNPLLRPPPPGGLFLLKPICWGGGGGRLFERLIKKGKKDPAELVKNIFLKWLQGVNKYCKTMRTELRQEGFQ